MEKAINCVAFFYKIGSSIKGLKKKKKNISKNGYYPHVTHRIS